MTSFPNRLRWFNAATVTAVLVAAALAARGSSPDFVAVALFGALVVFSEHRGVTLPSGVTVSPGFMVFMAAAVVFGHENGIAGALIVGAAAGLQVRDLTRGRFGWAVLNATTSGLSVAAATLAFAAAGHDLSGGTGRLLVAALPPALMFNVVSWTLLALSYLVEGNRRLRAVVADLFPATLHSLPFALVGVFLGKLYLALGPAVLLLLVVPIIVAREVFVAYMEVKATNEATVRVLIRALEAKDRYTAGHAERVAVYAGLIGEELGFLPWRLERLRFAALVHDIGKLVVPNHLLNKPGMLTADEFDRVRLHEDVSVEMLSQIDFLAPFAISSKSHHYRPDDAKHPIEPYIVAVADAYDAMTSTRSYRRALPREVAVRELLDKSGRQFHPACVAALVAGLARREARERDDDLIDLTDPGAHEYAIVPPESGVGSAGLGDLLDAEKSA